MVAILIRDKFHFFFRALRNLISFNKPFSSWNVELWTEKKVSCYTTIGLASPLPEKPLKRVLKATRSLAVHIPSEVIVHGEPTKNLPLGRKIRRSDHFPIFFYLLIMVNNVDFPGRQVNQPATEMLLFSFGPSSNSVVFVSSGEGFFERARMPFTVIRFGSNPFKFENTNWRKLCQKWKYWFPASTISRISSVAKVTDSTPTLANTETFEEPQRKSKSTCGQPFTRTTQWWLSELKAAEKAWDTSCPWFGC